MLTLRDVSKSFGGVVAVDQLTLDVPSRGITGLIGPNGAGKTTVFNLITAVFRPTAGRIELEGRSLVGRRPYEIVRLGIARTFQNVRLFRSMTVWEHLVVAQNHLAGGLGLRVPATNRERGLARDAADVLDLVGLWPRRDQPALSLPFGDQRRLEIARALATRPKLLLLDEPAAGMNAVESDALLGLVERLRDTGTSIVLIEHDMSVVMSVCERVVVLDFGRKIAEGSPEHVQSEPSVIEAYLGTGAAPSDV